VGDAVLEVHDIVAFDQFGKIEELVDLGALDGSAGVSRSAAGALPAEDLGLGYDGDIGRVSSDSQGRG